MVLSQWHVGLGIWGGLCYRGHQLIGAVTLLADPWYWYKNCMAYNQLYDVLLHNTSSAQKYNGAPHFIMEQIKLNYVTGPILCWYRSHAIGSIVTSTIRLPTFLYGTLQDQRPISDPNELKF
jgi:hypothetical protein